MSKRTPRLFVYRDRKGEWRWRLKSANGKIVAESGEGYKRKPDDAFFSMIVGAFQVAELVTQ